MVKLTSINEWHKLRNLALFLEVFKIVKVF